MVRLDTHAFRGTRQRASETALRVLNDSSSALAAVATQVKSEGLTRIPRDKIPLRDNLEETRNAVEIVPACIFEFIATHAIGHGTVIRILISHMLPTECCSNRCGSYWSIEAPSLVATDPSLIGKRILRMIA